MAPTYVSMLVVVLVNILTNFGVTVGSEELTTTINTLVTVAGGLYVMYRQVMTGKSTFAGMRPQK